MVDDMALPSVRSAGARAAAWCGSRRAAARAGPPARAGRGSRARPDLTSDQPPYTCLIHHISTQLSHIQRTI